MKKLVAFLTLALCLSAAIPVYSQTQAEKTLVKSFNLKGSDIVLLDLDGAVEVKEWDSKIMRIQMTISVENGSSSMLKSLIKVGRYNLTSSLENGDLKIFAPAMKKEIKARGRVLKENIVYTVFTPENVTVKMAGEASTNAEFSSSEPNSM